MGKWEYLPSEQLVLFTRDMINLSSTLTMTIRCMELSTFMRIVQYNKFEIMHRKLRRTKYESPWRNVRYIDKGRPGTLSYDEDGTTKIGDI